MLIAALRAPAAVGVNVTVTTQDALAATVAPQLFVSAKSPALVPVTVIPETFSTPVPELVSVKVCAALVDPTGLDANVRLAADKLTFGVTPVPSRGSVCGFAGALSATFNVADSTPVADGVKLTFTVQEAPATN